MSGKGIGIPLKLLHEAEGHTITAELKTGEMYRGTLLEAEDNWNSQMKDITVTGRDGRVYQLENVFIRGSKIRYLIIPDMLKNAPMFKRVDAAKAARGRGGGGRGRGGPSTRGKGRGRS